MTALPLLISDSPHVDDLRPSPNVNERAAGCRARYLIMHYTGLESVERSIDVLSRVDCEVSCHYVIDVDGRIIQMVSESLRAWHAGQSSWLGETDLNSLSIGIEIQNPGHANGYPDFPDAQMRAVLKLSQDIAARNAILPSAVLGHSDIAPGRKIDPGEKFRWDWLSRHGVGHWVEPAAVAANDPGFALGQSSDTVRQFQTDLKDYGYGIEVTGAHDQQSVTVVTAFQRHFRPNKVDGWIDRSTRETLSKLLQAREQIATV